MCKFNLNVKVDEDMEEKNSQKCFQIFEHELIITKRI